jgi:hypothetical protein
MLDVGYNAHCLTVELYSIASSAPWVIEGKRAQSHTWERLENIARPEIVKRHAGVQDVERHRKQGRLHQLLQDVLQTQAMRAQMACPELEMILAVIGRTKKGQTGNVVEVCVCKKQVRMPIVSVR